MDIRKQLSVAAVAAVGGTVALVVAAPVAASGHEGAQRAAGAVCLDVDHRRWLGGNGQDELGDNRRGATREGTDRSIRDIAYERFNSGSGGGHRVRGDAVSDDGTVRLG